jgi:hypothetical protein
VTAATAAPLDLRSERAIKILMPISLLHSLVYAVLIAVWLIPGLPRAEAVFGMTHGLMWIGMSLVCIALAARRMLPVRTGMAVAIIGGIGPFIGTYEFMRLRRNGGATFRST